MKGHTSCPFRKIANRRHNIHPGRYLSLCLDDGPPDRHARGARVGLRRAVSATEDAEGPADDSAGAERDHCAQDTPAAHDADRTGDLVFGNRKGHPPRESKLLRNVLQPAAEAAGLGQVMWHQFRHIHSSLLNDLRVPVKIA